MKKSFLLILSVALLGISLIHTGCQDNICVRVNGAIVTETLDLEPITAIDVKSVGVVEISTGSTQEVVVEVEEDVMDKLEITVENGKLSVGVDGCFTNDFDLKVSVTLPATQALTLLSTSGASTVSTVNSITVADEFSLDVSGAGSLVFVATNEPSTMNASVSGSGDCQFEGTVGTADVMVSGSGSLTLLGSADHLTGNLSGSGRIKAYEFYATDVTMGVSGSGTAEVRVEGGILDVTISSAGNVFYKGTPASIQENITGAGSLREMN